MANQTAQNVEEELRKSREVAESSRETEWQGAGFMKELFLGKLRLDLIHPYPLAGSERPEFRRFYDALEAFLRTEVDPVEIDELGEYPAQVLDGLRKLGAFALKVPVEYGGLGLTTRTSPPSSQRTSPSECRSRSSSSAPTS